MRCKQCGKENAPGDAFCIGCGKALQPGGSVPARKKTPMWLIVAVVAVALIIVAAVTVIGLGGSGTSGNVIVRVHNSEAVGITYHIYFNDTLVKEGYLLPGANAQWNTTVHIEGSSILAEARGTASWDGGGSSEAESSETLFRGGTVTLTLNL
jgi:hypothetical protein